MTQSSIEQNQYITYETYIQSSSQQNGQINVPNSLNSEQNNQIESKKQQQATLSKDSEEVQRKNVSIETHVEDEQRNKVEQDQKEKTEQQKQEEKQKKMSSCVSFIFGVLPLVIMVTVFLLFSFNKDIKDKVISIFVNIHEINFVTSVQLIGYGVILIFLSFPYIIFEMSLGFTFSYPVALLFAVTAKLLGEILCFALSRYVLKNCFLKVLRMNEYFIILEKAVKKNPSLVANLLRASILVPLFVVNFGSGIIEITFAQYIIPAFLWGTLYSMFTVLCGSQLMSIAEIVENAAFPQNKTLFIFELIMVILSAILMVVIIYKTGKMYEDIKAETQEALIQEKQQSNKSVDNCTVTSIGSEKQISSTSQQIEGDDIEAQQKKNNKIQQSSSPIFNVLSLENKYQYTY